MVPAHNFTPNEDNFDKMLRWDIVGYDIVAGSIKFLQINVQSKLK